MVAPYYQDDTCTIYHGDCREVSVSSDVVITDPPYGTDRYESDVVVATPTMLAEWCAIGNVAVFGWPEMLVELCAGRKPDEWVTWWPTNGRIRGFNLGGLWRESECVAVFGDRLTFSELRQARVGHARYVAGWYDTDKVGPENRLPVKPQTEGRLGDVWLDPSPHLGFHSAERFHPNEKPLSVMLRLVEGISVGSDVILDPFMGSGTTLRAAKDLGRKAIGIEIEERYCEIAAKRLAQEVLAL